MRIVALLLFVSLSIDAQITLLQSGTAQITSSGSAISVTFGSASIIGDIITVAEAGQAFSGSCLGAPTDTRSTVYSSAYSSGATSTFFAVYTGTVTSNGANIVTFPSGCNFGSVLIAEEWTNTIGLSASPGFAICTNCATINGQTFLTSAPAMAICFHFLFAGSSFATLTSGSIDQTVTNGNLSMTAGFQSVASVASTYTNTWSIAGQFIPVLFIFNASPPPAYVPNPWVVMVN